MDNHIDDIACIGIVVKEDAEPISDVKPAYVDEDFEVQYDVPEGKQQPQITIEFIT